MTETRSNGTLRRVGLLANAVHVLEAVATAAACVVILEAGYRFATRNK